MYRRGANDVWTQLGAKIIPSDATGSGAFGFGLKLSNDGNNAIVSDSSDGPVQGAVWFFSRSGNALSQMRNKISGTGAGVLSRFGSSVELDGDGSTALIGVIAI